MSGVKNFVSEHKGALLGSVLGPMGTIGGAMSDSSGGADPTVSTQTANPFLDQMKANSASISSKDFADLSDRFSRGEMSNQDALKGFGPAQANALSTGAATGSKFATNEVMNNPLLMQGLDSMKGQLEHGQGLQNGQEGILSGLQNQGFQLKPEDQTMYGQTAGNIGRMFGQQGNQAAQDLAMRGLSNSGAAGSAFSGMQGNQNEMLAQAQQQIMQQRFQNTMGQIKQQQDFIGQLNNQNNAAAGNYAGQGAKDIQDQYGRQLAGAQQYDDNMKAGAATQESNNQNYNTAMLNKGLFEQQNKPMGFGDYLKAGVGSSLYNIAGAPGKFVSSAAGGAGKGAASGAGG